MKKPTLGVFGFGQFMEFFTPYLSKYFEIYIYDRTGKKAPNIIEIGACVGSLQQTAECEYVLLGYPNKYIGDLIQNIVPYLQEEAVVFDICSVKKEPVMSMLKYLPASCHIIATHPIFGPQSGKNGIQGLTMTISNIRANKDVFDHFSKFFSQGLELQVLNVSPEDHDKQMAYIQGITHFIGRALKDMGIPHSGLATQSYLHLCETKEMVGNDSDALFLSIQGDNPYIPEVRKKLLHTFQELDSWIQSQ